ncbi:MAG: serine/threonine protein kinase [Elusimicrobia bacterium]|nr:serine/threonine protein kinase [Elusimicrobiota bacterium]
MRPRLAAWAVAAALAAPAAGSARGGATATDPPGPVDPTGLESAHARLDGMKARMQAMMAGLQEKRDRLLRLQTEYVTEARLQAVAGERDALRGDLRARQQTLSAASDDFEEKVKTYNAQMAVSGLSRMWDVKTKQKDGKTRLEMEAGTELTRAMNYDTFRKEYSAVIREIKIALAEDESAYHTALSRFADARRRRWTRASLAALLVIAAGLALARRRVGGWLNSGAPSTSPSVPFGPASGPVGEREEGLAPGAVLGQNFEIERELGRGGMGVVYEALDLSLRRRVAVKRMRAEISRRDRDLERFLEEARLVAALKHPHIVEIHAVLREAREVYLVFELVRGRPLDRLLAERGRLPAADTVAIARRVAAALDYAHAQRVIHRDLKPGNVMVGDGDELKVMDFGLAHQASQTVARLTKAESWGTPPYMAPEQEVGEVSRASDVFSFGVCAYEMLAGRLPFDEADLLAQKRAGRWARPSSIGLPAALDPVFNRALDPQPDARFRTAGEFAAALAGASS